MQQEQSSVAASLLRAVRFAAVAHAGQRRKDAEKTPYVNHPIEVADTLARCGVTDEEVLVAAILHDTVEDTSVTLEVIELSFGSRVAGIVGELSDNKSLPKEERKRLQIKHAAGKSPEAKLVGLADKICNVSDISYDNPAAWDEARKCQYVAWAIEVAEGYEGENPELDAVFDIAVASSAYSLAI